MPCWTNPVTFFFAPIVATAVGSSYSYSNVNLKWAMRPYFSVHLKRTHHICYKARLKYRSCLFLNLFSALRRCCRCHSLPLPHAAVWALRSVQRDSVASGARCRACQYMGQSDRIGRRSCPSHWMGGLLPMARPVAAPRCPPRLPPLRLASAVAPHFVVSASPVTYNDWGVRF